MYVRMHVHVRIWLIFAFVFTNENRFLLPEVVERVRDRYEPLFRGEFETGVYPDEWYGRAGMNLEHATKEICNAWKSDRTIARYSID
jgi:hypothetical protein